MLQDLHSMHCHWYVLTACIMLSVNCRHVGWPAGDRREETRKVMKTDGMDSQRMNKTNAVVFERHLFTRRPWIGADSRRRRTDTSKHIYIIHQKPICIICFSNVSPVLIKMNKLLTVFPSVRRFLNSPFSLCCGKKIILLKWFNKMFCLWDK